MSCIVNILDQSVLGEDPGGTLVFDFYDSDQDGLPNDGGSIIEPDADGNVNFDGVIPGDYYFTYSGGEMPDCYAELPFYIRVLERADAGIGQTIDMCLGDDAINLFSLLLGTPDETGSWSGDGTLSPFYTPGDVNDPMDDTFEPDISLTPGVYTFVYTVNQITPNGFTLVDCENCDSQSATITINVIDCAPAECDSGISNAVSVCSSIGCQFNLIDQLGGTPDTGGVWIQLTGPQAIIPTNGDQGTVNFLNALVGTYQFSYTVGTCVSIITVTVVATPNAGCNGTRALCESSGPVNLFSNLGCNPNSGGTWVLSPTLPVGTFAPNGTINPAPGDAGVYVATYTVENPVSGPCGGVCIDTATVTVTITANCFAGNDATTVVCDTASIVLDPAVLLGATGLGGTWFCGGQSLNCNNTYGSALFSVNGGPIENQQGDNIPNLATLNNFQNLGCIILQYVCTTANPNCNDVAELIIQVIDCAPSCAASVTISAVNCALSSVVSGTCPSPIYQWQVFQSGSWIAAPSPNNTSTYTGLDGKTYRLRVTGCPNCNALYSNQITVSCTPPPSCSITCSLVYNTSLQRLEGTITNSGGSGGSMPYQFNKYNTNNANCLLCTGVGPALCSGNVTIPPSGSITIYCNVPQTSSEQCVRLVVSASNGPCNNTLCCAKIPAAASMCFELPSLSSFTDITQLKVNYGSGAINILGEPDFNCTEYESTQPNGPMNGNINCSLAQLVNDINQWLATEGYLGTAYVIQKAKSSSIRIKDTDITFVSVTSQTFGVINFAPSGCGGCDSTSWHFQGLNTTDNFQGTFGVNGYLNPSVGDTINLFDLLDEYFGGSPVDLPHTGTFTVATCNVPTGGCIDINTNCWTDCTPPPPTPLVVTNHVGFGDHGDLTWTPFVPATGNVCFWHVRYLVTLPNGCSECIIIVLNFDFAL